MNKDNEKVMPTKLELAYTDLNDARKSLLRTSFLEKFEFKNVTFYKKLHNHTPVKTMEKEFFAKYFETTVEDLFN